MFVFLRLFFDLSARRKSRRALYNPEVQSIEFDIWRVCCWSGTPRLRLGFYLIYGSEFFVFLGSISQIGARFVYPSDRYRWKIRNKIMIRQNTAIEFFFCSFYSISIWFGSIRVRLPNLISIFYYSYWLFLFANSLIVRAAICLPSMYATKWGAREMQRKLLLASAKM